MVEEFQKWILVRGPIVNVPVRNWIIIFISYVFSPLITSVVFHPGNSPILISTGQEISHEAVLLSYLIMSLGQFPQDA